jgi:hypothetical protein
LAVDFGYAAQRTALSNDDRDRLNKDLLHYSYDRLRHTPETKPWPDSILSNLLDPVLEFMRYVRDEKNDLLGSEEERDNWCHLIRLLEFGRELRIRVSSGVDRVPRYEFDLGPPLPSGKPVLTQHIASPVMRFGGED